MDEQAGQESVDQPTEAPQSQPPGNGSNSQVYDDLKAGYKDAEPHLRRALWQGKIGPAFWTVVGVFSLIVNILLVVVIILLGRYLFDLKDIIQEQLVRGLYDNFVLMDQAHIATTITVSETIQVADTIPVVFELPLSQETTVVLTQDTQINQATILLNGVWIPLDIVLPQGTPLNIQLDLMVPVNQTVPVQLSVPVKLVVPVDIPLSQTQLHRPFVGLQEVVAPFDELLGDLPDNWEDVPFCSSWTGWICSMFFKKR